MTDTAWKKFLKRFRLVSAVKEAQLTEIRSEGFLTGAWVVKEHKHLFKLYASPDSRFLKFECKCGDIRSIAKWYWEARIIEGIQQRKVREIFSGYDSETRVYTTNREWSDWKPGTPIDGR